MKSPPIQKIHGSPSAEDVWNQSEGQPSFRIVLPNSRRSLIGHLKRVIDAKDRELGKLRTESSEDLCVLLRQHLGECDA